MKFVATILGLVVSVAVLAGCASKCNECPSAVAPAPAHHDMKCETK